MFSWYVVATLTAMEARARDEIERRASRTTGIRQAVIPVERIAEVVAGRKVITEARKMPGYVLVEMEMSPRTMTLVRHAAGVTHFLGGKAPTPLPQADVDRLLRDQLDLGDGVELDVAVGEVISIATGPFKDFAGPVVEVNQDAGKLKFMAEIFGRPTPLEVSFDQVRLAA